MWSLWLRTATDLVQLELPRPPPLGASALPLPDPPEQQVESPACAPRFGAVRRPHLPTDRLKAAWEGVGRARGATPRTLADVLIVLFDTVADPDDPTAPPPLHLAPPAPPPRATAAHPRAFRGTIHQPPRDRLPDEVDLRPYLLHRSTLLPLLHELALHAEAALALLEGELDAGMRARVAQALAAKKGLDVALAVRQGLFVAPAPPRLALVERTLDGTEVGPWRAAWAALGAEDRPALALLLLHLHTHFPTHALGWATLLARVPPPHQVELLALWMDAGAPEREPFAAVEALVEPLGLDGVGAVWRHRAWHLGASWQRGVSEAGLVVGLTWLRAFLPMASGPELSTEPDLSLEAMERLWEPLGRHDPSERWGAAWLIYRLWERSAQLPGLGALLVSPELLALDDESLHHWCDRLSVFVYQDCDEDTVQAKWLIVRGWLLDFTRDVGRAPQPLRAKALRLLLGFVFTWDELEIFEKMLHRSRRLIGALCVEGFSPERSVETTWAWLIELLDDEGFEALLAHRHALRVLERRSIWENDGYLVAAGIHRLLRAFPSWTLEALLRYPAAFAAAARRVGVMREAWAMDLLRGLKDEPMLAAQITPEQLWEAATQPPRPGQHALLPRRARRDLLRGALSDARRERALRVARRFLPLARLQRVHRAVLERMAGTTGADVDNPAHRVALEMAHNLHTHRRVLRRFLREHLGAAQPRPLHAHPANARWLKAHPKLDAQRWLEGITLRCNIAGRGQVTLALEQDPLEVLRLGQYVGSCLGVGGMCDYSAAAVVLDVNKQVVYARDAKGRVLARQLVAVTSADSLQCFSPYPEWARQSESMSQAFRDFDHALARALGLPLSTNEDEGDERIEQILSRDFWYDGLWQELDSAPQQDS
jgi:hypothetical protein